MSDATGPADVAYLALLQDLLRRGDPVRSRNGETLRLWGQSCHFWMTPLVSARRTAWKNALREWEWFLTGSDRLEDLHPAVRPWWQPWSRDGRVPFNYSVQLRHAAGHGGRAVDQVQYLLDGLREHPHGRRHVLTTWNAADMTNPECPITNCHNTLTQLFVTSKKALHMETFQRSVDVIVGLPHNWVQNWAFLLWLARRSGLTPGSLLWHGGDVHLYTQHQDLARRLLGAPESLWGGEANVPALVYSPSGDDFKADDFSLSGPYRPLLDERAEMVV